MNATNYEPHPQVIVHLSMEQAHRLGEVLHGPGWQDILFKLRDAIDVASESQDGLDPEDHP